MPDNIGSRERSTDPHGALARQFVEALISLPDERRAALARGLDVMESPAYRDAVAATQETVRESSSRHELYALMWELEARIDAGVHRPRLRVAARNVVRALLVRHRPRMAERLAVLAGPLRDALPAGWMERDAE